jgi:hypothetical protein
MGTPDMAVATTLPDDTPLMAGKPALFRFVLVLLKERERAMPLT